MSFLLWYHFLVHYLLMLWIEVCLFIAPINFPYLYNFGTDCLTSGSDNFCAKKVNFKITSELIKDYCQENPFHRYLMNLKNTWAHAGAFFWSILPFRNSIYLRVLWQRPSKFSSTWNFCLNQTTTFSISLIAFHISL